MKNIRGFDDYERLFSLFEDEKGARVECYFLLPILAYAARLEPGFVFSTREFSAKFISPDGSIGDIISDILRSTEKYESMTFGETASFSLDSIMRSALEKAFGTEEFADVVKTITARTRLDFGSTEDEYKAILDAFETELAAAVRDMFEYCEGKIRNILRQSVSSGVIRKGI
jgi:hypothetical protein